MHPQRTVLQARLFFCAVWPTLGDFWPWDAPAREVAAEPFSIGLRGPGNLRLRLAAEPEQCAVNAEPTSADLELRFFTAAQVVATFEQRRTLPPVPTRGLHRLGLTAKLTQLGQRLEHWLRPDAQQLTDETFASRFAWLQLGLGLRAVAVLAEHEPTAYQRWQQGPKGTAVFRVGTGHPPRWLTLGEHAVATGTGEAPSPADVTVTFNDTATALASVRDELDAMAAVNRGSVTLDGLVPLADHLNHLLERVTLYLER